MPLRKIVRNGHVGGCDFEDLRLWFHLDLLDYQNMSRLRKRAIFELNVATECQGTYDFIDVLRQVAILKPKPVH